MDAFEKKKLNIKSIIFIAAMAVVCAAVCVLLFYANIISTVALEQELRCGIEEHVHTDSCYEGDFQVCTKTAHSHDGNCYIVLLGENDINGILTLLGNSQDHSLENVINDTMSKALNFNENLNSSQSSEGEKEPLTLSQDTVEELNTTISDKEDLPDLILNENINTPRTLAQQHETSIKEGLTNSTSSDKNALVGNVTNNINANSSGAGVSTFAIGSTENNNNNYANFYVFLDREWTCVGTLEFGRTGSGFQYNCVVDTAELLGLVNGSLQTDLKYTDINVVSTTTKDGDYINWGTMGVGETTTTIASQQTNATSKRAKYVRLIPAGKTEDTEELAFYTVKFKFPDQSEVSQIVLTGTRVTLPAGSQWTDEDGNIYEGGQAYTIRTTMTFEGVVLAPIDNIKIKYDVAFPTVSGVTVATKPTIAGLTTTTATDGFTEGASAVIRNVSEQMVKGKVNGSPSGISRIIQFKGWRVGNTGTILQPNTTLVWEELLQYADETELELRAVWDYNALQTVTFFIRFDSVAVDTEGNITGQDTNKYTKELFAAYVGGVNTNLGTGGLGKYNQSDVSQDNSFSVDQRIRALYGERQDGVWLTAFPDDAFIFESLKEYANTGYLSVDGVPVKAEDLNSKAYAIRWYVFKVQDDAWHIDGKLVKKEGLIHVYKTFAGNKNLIADAKSDFYIDAKDVTAGTNTVLNLDNAKNHNQATDTYMWEITNVDYGELWQITEHPHFFEDSGVEFGMYSAYTIMDALGDQSITGTGTSLSVSGMTYALDEGTDEVLRAEFTNIYNKKDSIIIKKQDALTGASIGGATFRLLQNGRALKFNYNSNTNSYEYDAAGGTQTVLSGTENGYFEISIEDFSYDQGPITVQEVKQPTGYTPIGNIEIGYTDDNGTIGIIGGNSEMIRYVNGILIVGNSTDSMSVTAKKSWDCPENEWQDVTVQLLANEKLVTTTITGVAPQVVLNRDNNWQHTWDNLPVYVNGEKIVWSIKETKIGTESAKADGSFVNWLVSYELPKQTTDEDGKENVLLTVTNTTKRVMLRLTKTDLSKRKQLSGAKFLLEAVDERGNVLTNEIAKTATTGDVGTLIFDNLKCDVRYRLYEETAPKGYLKPNEYIYFKINEDGSVNVEESYYAEFGSTAYNIIVRNATGAALPESGSIGTSMFYTIGLLIMLVSAGIYINIFSKKRRCQN